MKFLGLVVAVFMICIGLLGMIVPYPFLTAAEYTITPKGLYLIAALRVVVGLILLAAASASRLPKTL
jgi:hypothetical protein